jgi:hypothetical protein
MKIYLTSSGTLSVPLCFADRLCAQQQDLVRTSTIDIPLDGQDDVLDLSQVSSLSLSPIAETDEFDELEDRYYRELVVCGWGSTITVRLSSNDRQVLELTDGPDCRDRPSKS